MNGDFVSSSLLVSGAPPCGFRSLGDRGSNVTPLASGGKELTFGSYVVIWGLPSLLALFIFLTFFDAA